MNLPAFLFKNRGLILSLPAALLLRFGRPSVESILAGLPFALAGELVRCWAVGYSGVTTRGATVTAGNLVTAGPYAYVRNPLYLGNALTAAGFAIAFTGKNSTAARAALMGGSLAAMLGLYSAIVAHEEDFLRSRFGDEFERYCARVPRVIPRLKPSACGEGDWRAEALIAAESKTFATFTAMLAALLMRVRNA